MKEAVRSHSAGPIEGSLADQIEAIARDLASGLHIPESHVIGITAVAVMVLCQVGPEVFSAGSTQPPPERSSPDQILKARARRGAGMLGFLRTVDSRYTVVFDERDKSASFKAIQGQDVSMAAGMDSREHQSKDERCREGPIPFQCRTGTCGTRRMGVLSGKDRLSPISDWERNRLQYFGYDFGSADRETHPRFVFPVRSSAWAISPSPLLPGTECLTSSASMRTGNPRERLIRTIPFREVSCNSKQGGVRLGGCP